jgi:pimeloyl-ACP methyl ester carboxylesterase
MPVAQAEGAKIYYEVHGEGHPVFFIHGGGGNTLAWFQQVPFFSKSFKVITVDLRGFKFSTCEPDAAHPKYFPADIRSIMKNEGIARAAFVCQSLGAWAGLPLAARHPELVSCIAINGSPTPAYSEENWRVLRSSGDIFNSGRMGRTGAIGWSKTYPARNPAMYFLYAQLKELNRPFDARRMQEDSVKLHPQDFANYSVPTLVAGGAHDDFLTPTHHVHVATLIPGAVTHTFPNAGHSAYFETPDEFNQAVSGFLMRQKL